ncbi:MtrAB system histidine kinase MtrB [Homoserinimonas sp. OAct 916]|uniref:MtrAB system histidine kinase MtrB n=1 Tax=Homoserinimonas sp. OAct 916 TaxID=2211450 RepID=UPI001E4ECEEB|nr:MtrAB system histidine kinase MtrB [Homoserinimonas sp. OAct 916]
MNRRAWLNWPLVVVDAWRRSLQLRTALITVVLSGLAVLGTGAYMSYSISHDLFDARVAQVSEDSARATTAAQRLLDASDAADRVAVQNVFNSARTSIRDASSSQLIAFFRVPGQASSSVAPQARISPELAEGVISPELRLAVQQGNSGQYWQSVSLHHADSATPGIIVGSELMLPAAGRYELYIGYDLGDTEQTLQFVQQILLFGGLVLVFLIGAVAWLVARLVVTPVQIAANTSQQLAAGNFAVRMPVRGRDVMAQLAQSFNGMADSLERQIRELAELSVMQQRFVSDVSHELRTPLTTIRLAGDLLYDERDKFEPATQRTAELMHTQVQRFEVLLTDLLEISRYDAGSVESEPEPTNLVRLAEDTIESVSSLAEAAGSDLRLVAPGGHFDVDVDPRRIRRIMRNLLGNAIEHGPNKPIVVTIDSNESAIALSVRDYGHGMTDDEVRHVFDRFWRADPSRQRTLGGTGLGLAIALEDAALHHGWLQVWSKPGQGACFVLTLPRALGTEIESSPISLPPADAVKEEQS